MADKLREKREFLRIDYNKPLAYRIISKSEDKDLASKFMIAVSKNLSASGILFISNVAKIPEIASLVVLDLDYRTAGVCQEIEDKALILDNKIIGRVVRIEDNEDDTCEIGVAFVKRSEPMLPILKDIESLIE